MRPDLLMSDQDLLGQCDVHTYRASGPGGQHRNKVSSAVRLRHRPTGITAHGDDSRSQHDNRRLALRRLRLNFACQLRDQVDLAQPHPPPAWADFLARGAKLPGGVRGAAPQVDDPGAVVPGRHGRAGAGGLGQHPLERRPHRFEARSGDAAARKCPRRASTSSLPALRVIRW
jgi:hypothetical protein